MLPCVCSVIDQRWRQNVVRTKKWHTRRSRVCHWCSYHILTSSVIYYWTDTRQHGINRPFLSSPPFQSEAKCEVFYENQFSFILKFDLITITKISHLDSLGRRDLGELGNGLFIAYNKKLKYTEKLPFYFKFRHIDRHENSTDVI